MWARHIEAVIGIWIGFSWIIFRYSADETALQINDWISAILLNFFSLITYRDQFRYFHLFNFLIGLWFVSWVIHSGTGIHYGPHQNYMVAGLLLMMLSLVPSRTKEPPRGWVKFLVKKKKL